MFFVYSGDDIFSQAVARQVPSALRSLTTVFGMGTGVTSSLKSPKNCVQQYRQSISANITFPRRYIYLLRYNLYFVTLHPLSRFYVSKRFRITPRIFIYHFRYNPLSRDASPFIGVHHIYISNLSV